MSNIIPYKIPFWVHIQNIQFYFLAGQTVKNVGDFLGHLKIFKRMLTSSRVRVSVRNASIYHFKSSLFIVSRAIWYLCLIPL